MPTCLTKRWYARFPFCLQNETHTLRYVEIIWLQYAIKTGVVPTLYSKFLTKELLSLFY